MTDQEKTAGVLDTPTTASQDQCAAILGRLDADRKAYATLQAQLALRGYALNRTHHVPDRRVTYTVSRCGRSRAFGDLHDVRAFLTQLSEVAS